jgi:hypothetical protein
MFWFPAPERVDPRVEEFLAFEREWLTGEWTTEKIVAAMIPPLIIGAMCLAFWKRSLTWGLVVINAMAVTKLLWGIIDGEGSGWAMLAPALAGLLVCNAVVLYAISRLRTRSSRGPRGRVPTTLWDSGAFHCALFTQRRGETGRRATETSIKRCHELPANMSLDSAKSRG